MNFTGLSLDQAPPLDAPARFFITAPIFGMLAAVLIFLTDPALLLSRHSMESIVIVHLFTIGMFAMAMLGALQQMLPVLAGVSLPKAKGVATFSHLALALGLLSMAVGLLQSSKIMLILAAVGLGAGFIVLLTAIALAMKKVAFFTPTVKVMMVAVTTAFLVALLGLHLLGGYASGNISALQVMLADIHSVWAVFGFAGLLIIGVAFQVLPMFYVTPQFKTFTTQFMVPLIILGLVTWLVLNIFLPEYAWTGKLIVTLFFLAFSAMIVKKFRERRRPVSDVTVRYWNLGAILLAPGLLLWQADAWLEVDYISIVSVLIGGFVLSVISGMLYKIIPFLVWFHLNGQGYMSVPTMNEMIDKKLALTQFILFAFSIGLFIAAFWVPLLTKIGALSLFISMALLEYNLVQALSVYRTIRKKPPEFEMIPPV